MSAVFLLYSAEVKKREKFLGMSDDLTVPQLRPHSHKTRDATRMQIRTQILWCCLGEMWILPLMTKVPFACIALRVASRILCEWGLIWLDSLLPRVLPMRSTQICKNIWKLFRGSNAKFSDIALLAEGWTHRRIEGVETRLLGKVLETTEINDQWGLRQRN